MDKIEILAPAGSFDSLVAAVRSGADAVYVGGKAFSARASAQNFDADELKRAVDYCHIHGVKVYVTINTIVFDDELEKLKRAITEAAEAQVDALIVQNMGVARLASQIAPQLALHASTQMSVHTKAGVQALYEMGFKRVVLSREMSLDEIKKAAEVPVELEVFVHGALCMCVSGQCYFSAMLGSRSGNRGACAQPCRLPFSVGNQRDGHALSLKDNSLINHLSELELLGVASAKIEGRMKRPEYVSMAVRACREQRDNGFVSEKTAEMLKGVFSRTGFTDGYLTGSRGQSMFGTRRRDDVVSADEALFSKIRQSYKDEIRNISISGCFTAHIGEVPVLEISDGCHNAVVKSDVLCEKAMNKPLSEERVRQQLEKTGGTAYYFERLDVSVDSEGTLPMSALNAMRREALAILDEQRSNVHSYDISDVDLTEVLVPYKQSFSYTRARIPSVKINPAFKECELVYVPLFSATPDILKLKEQGYKVAVEVPRGMFGIEDRIEKKLSELKQAGVCDVLCHNIGALYIAKRLGMTMHGGFGQNLVNTLDMLWAEEYGLKDTELSFELTFERINRLGGKLPRGFISYGRLPLMLCRNCPNKSIGIECSSCKNKSVLKDRRNIPFPMRCDGNCTEILNSLPLFIAEEEISEVSSSFNILRFSVENYVETVERIKGFNAFSTSDDKLTRGLYHRGVK